MTGLGWFGIVRLGLVQAMIGAVVVLTTSTLNRVLVVEMMLPALLPGLLVGWHYAVQVSRPRMGFGSDLGARRTPWILGGMAVLAAGGFLGAVATAWAGTSRTAALALLFVAFTLVGLGVSAAGTSLLAMLAKRVDAPRRASAAATVWVMMIVGFAVTAGTAGRFLDPYTPERLVAVSGTVSLIAVIVTMLALWRLEGRVSIDAGRVTTADAAPAPRPSFKAALAEVWAEPDARRFTVFVFVSMIAYSAQDLILEPFAGLMFGYTPGESTQLSGVQHGGTLAGMLLAALAGRRLFGVGFGSLRAWTMWGCVASCVALAGLAFAGFAGEPVIQAWPLRANVFLMGVANGAFSIAAIGSMMALAGGAASTPSAARASALATPTREDAYNSTPREGAYNNALREGAYNNALREGAYNSTPREGAYNSTPREGAYDNALREGALNAKTAREGTRMGLWGAAQAIGFAGGGIIGTGASDLARWVIGSPGAAYALVFAAEAVLFVASAWLARRIAVPAGVVGSDALPVMAGVQPAKEATT